MWWFSCGCVIYAGLDKAWVRGCECGWLNLYRSGKGSCMEQCGCDAGVTHWPDQEKRSIRTPDRVKPRASHAGAGKRNKYAVRGTALAPGAPCDDATVPCATVSHVYAHVYFTCWFFQFFFFFFSSLRLSQSVLKSGIREKVFRAMRGKTQSEKEHTKWKSFS